MSESTEKTRYLPEELPNHLFTQKKLSQLGLVPIGEHVAYVSYPEQKNATSQQKKQKSSKVLTRLGSMTVENILKERENEMKIRKEQLHNK
jgi:hypothetical protein